MEDSWPHFGSEGDTECGYPCTSYTNSKPRKCSDSSSPDIYNYNLTKILNDENETKLSLYCDNTGTDFILYNNIGSGITGHSNRKLLYSGGESVPGQGTVSTNK